MSEFKHSGRQAYSTRSFFIAIASPLNLVKQPNISSRVLIAIALLPFITSIEVKRYTLRSEIYFERVEFKFGIFRRIEIDNGSAHFQRTQQDSTTQTLSENADIRSKPTPPPSGDSPTIVIKREGNYEDWCRPSPNTDGTAYDDFVRVISTGLGCGSDGIHVQTICSDTGTCTDSNTTCTAPPQSPTVRAPPPFPTVRRRHPPTRAAAQHRPWRIGPDGGSAMWVVFTVPRATYAAFLAWTPGVGAAPLRDELSVIAVEVAPQNSGETPRRPSFPHPEPRPGPRPGIIQLGAAGWTPFPR
jgi:hypothetical protein